MKCHALSHQNVSGGWLSMSHTDFAHIFDVGGGIREVANNSIAWIDSYEEGEEILNSKPTDRLLAPSRVHPPQHQFVPSNLPRRMSQDGFVDTYDDVSQGGLEKKPETGFFGGHKEPVKGRKWDHARDGDPVIMQSLSTSSPWRMYIKSSMYGPAQEEDGKVVDANFLQQQTPGYQKPWRGDLEGNGDPEKGFLHNKKKQKSMMRKVQVRLLPSPCSNLFNRDSTTSSCIHSYHWCFESLSS
jgi:hypothetical protein